MSKTYGQYCPVAIASEILGERWTILVVMVLKDGLSRFNEIERALPRISASTLSARLKSLEAAGVLERAQERGEAAHYLLTPAGHELGEIVYGIGAWGHRWGRDLEPDDFDPEHLIWSMHLRMDLAIMPKERTTIAFEFSDQPATKRYFWIVVQNGQTQACLKNPGFDEDLRVVSELRPFTYAWRGFTTLAAEIERGAIKLFGPRQLCRAFPDWLLLSMLAGEPRYREGKEKRLQVSQRRAQDIT